MLSRIPTSLVVLALSVCSCQAASADDFSALQSAFEQRQQSVLAEYCLGCHSSAEHQGELDLERFQSVSDIRRDVVPWQRVIEMLDDGEMPPKDATPQPTVEQIAGLRGWVKALLDADAAANAGDPGPVVLRRLNNAEFNYTIEDLTGVALQPAREFPADSAAGEGFTNVGQALAMSPALVQKYLDAARDVSRHAVLLPDGIKFSPHTTPRDWTDEKLAAIRQLYARHSDASGGTSVNLQGIEFDTNGGGRLPVARYLQASLEERAALLAGTTSIVDVARQRGLNERYLGTLWQTLHSESPTLLTAQLQELWRNTKGSDPAELVAFVERWQSALWRFTTVGHIGKRDGPPAWMVRVDPLMTQQQIRQRPPAANSDGIITVYLTTTDAGDGADGDIAVWSNPRFVAEGRPDLSLRDVRSAAAGISRYREPLLASTAACLKAAVDPGAVEVVTDPSRLPEFAARYQVEPLVMATWLSFLGVGDSTAVVSGHLEDRLSQVSSYDFVNGWAGADALSVLANNSDQTVRVPGEMAPHSIAVHPAPDRRVVIGWRSPVTAALKLTGRVQRAHMGCGNGVEWRLEVRRGRTRQTLARGIAEGSESQPFVVDSLSVLPDDFVALVIGPRGGNHSCDLTAVDMRLEPLAGAELPVWDLAADTVPQILDGNPHADSTGRERVWHFTSRPTAAIDDNHQVPPGSLLARWQVSQSESEAAEHADALQRLLSGVAEPLPPEHPDAHLLATLRMSTGPLMSELRRHVLAQSESDEASLLSSEDSVHDSFGLDPEAFGRHPDTGEVGAADLCVQAPSVLEVRVPAELVGGCEFVASGILHAPTGADGSVQFRFLNEPPEAGERLTAGGFREVGSKSVWSDGQSPVQHDSPVVVGDSGATRERLLRSFDEFAQLFPAALCYTRIVPVDEVVTLTLFYREDDHLRRLMLSPEETAELNRLWDELIWVSRLPLQQVDAYEQLWQYATQDADPSAFEPMREGILQRAAEFRSQLASAEPVQIESVVKFAERAWRRPLTSSERARLPVQYQDFREGGMDHDAAIRNLLSRVLVAPAFLYKLEKAQPGTTATQISSHELATRLSYFLWSSLPDAELRAAADDGTLSDPAVLRAETSRMLRDAKVRRLAIEFGCQWLHIREFDQFDEKSEQHYPEFRELRGDMYEEAIRLFEDFFRGNRPVLSLLECDHTFVNNRLARFYELTDPRGESFAWLPDGEWTRLDGLRGTGRGGVLTLAATLSKHSGASRTSPILRGNWVSESLLGDKLPRPPKDVPVLPEQAPQGLTERQLIEQHSRDPACAKCHARIDGFGFALEQFDTIGRRRALDAQGQKINTTALLPDGTSLHDADELRSYLGTTRRADFTATFLRRLLGYALGRGVQLSDEPLLTEMQRQILESDASIESAVQAIVLSPQFRMIRGGDRSPD
jgi:hypothetical protein